MPEASSVFYDVYVSPFFTQRHVESRDGPIPRR